MNREVRLPRTASLFSPPFPIVNEYVTRDLSVRTALLALYSGVALSAVDHGRGTATFRFGTSSVTVPLRLLSNPPPQVGDLLTETDAIQIGTQLCTRAGWSVCYDFLRARQTLPVFSRLFDEASVAVAAGTPWVVAHALQIRSSAVQHATLAAFQTLSVDIPHYDTLEKRLEKTLAATLTLSVADATVFFQFTAAFQLQPALKTAHGGPPQVLVGGIVPVYYPLRDWCFVTVFCLAAPTAVWSSPPALYKAGTAAQ